MWLGLYLWLVICLGEMGWVTQSSLALWLWVALFTLPTVYVTCRAAADALVEEGLLFVLSAIQGGESPLLLSRRLSPVRTGGRVDSQPVTEQEHECSLTELSTEGFVFLYAVEKSQGTCSLTTWQCQLPAPCGEGAWPGLASWTNA